MTEPQIHNIVSVKQGRLIAAPPWLSRIWIVTCACGWWGEPGVFGLHVQYASLTHAEPQP